MPRADGTPTIAELVISVDEPEDPRADKPWDPKYDCDGCDKHQRGPHRFGCHSAYASTWRLMWVARHGRFGAGPEELRGTAMTHEEFVATCDARGALVREVGVTWYASLTNEEADARVRALAASEPHVDDEEADR